MEVTTHTVFSREQKVSILLEGLQKKDGYGTNLELTGQGNWFGSLNMCNMLADNSHELFASIDDKSSCDESSGYSLLELGSGLGRAGLMAVKLIDLESKRNEDTQLSQNRLHNTSQVVSPSWNCVLSDGEEEVMELLNNNYHRNFHNTGDTAEDSSANRTLYPDSSSSETKCDCQQLWWGENAELLALRASHPLGFDLIIGADLIYGRDVVTETEAEDGDGADEHEQVEGTAESKVGDGFCRDKLKSLLYTVNALLSHRGSSSSPTAASTNSDTHSDTQSDERSDSVDAPATPQCAPEPSTIGISDFDVRRRPGFYLAVTRRELLPIEELRAVALLAGLQVSLLEDYTFDIFDTNVDSESMFWRDTILLFTRV